MEWLLDLSASQLQRIFAEQKFPGYTAKQVFNWIYQRRQPQVSLWTNISRTRREWIRSHLDTRLNEVVESVRAEDGATKLMFRLGDGCLVEAVHIPETSHDTLCISSQVGCALGCTFCATGAMGFTRHLTAGEILSQVLSLQDQAKQQRPTNLVFMGMGEPLLNYDSLARALEIILAQQGMAIPPRRVTVSTAGILTGIRRLEADFPRVRLAFSLNAPDSALRERVMPINRTNPLEEIIAYFRSHRRRHPVTFEYVLIRGVNDSTDHAQRTARLLRGIHGKINLIPCNPSPGLPFKRTSGKETDRFAAVLSAAGMTVTIRNSRGASVRSACGQLAAGSRTEKKTRNRSV